MILATVLVWNRLWLSIVVIVVVDKVSGEKNYCIKATGGTSSIRWLINQRRTVWQEERGVSGDLVLERRHS